MTDKISVLLSQLNDKIRDEEARKQMALEPRPFDTFENGRDSTQPLFSGSMLDEDAGVQEENGTERLDNGENMVANVDLLKKISKSKPLSFSANGSETPNPFKVLIHAKNNHK